MKTPETKKQRVTSGGRKPRQDGYALLLVIFLCSVLLISAIAVSPNIATQGRREREQEMIWRGKQYVRAISLYRRKTGKFPASLEDLAKGQPGIHFLRKQYKDPFNKEDGSWRLIYLGPAGQLVGSFNSNKLGGPFLVVPNASTLNSTSSPAAPGSNTFGQGSSLGQAFSQPGGQNQAGAQSGASVVPAPSVELPPGNASDTPAIVGGAIVGVGSKIDHSSVIIFNKVGNYRLFEFIWDATKDLNLSGLPGVPGAPAGDPNFHPPQPPPPDPAPPTPQPGPPQP